MTSIQVILIQSIYYFSRFLILMIFIRIILSWLPIDRSGPIMRFLYGLTEPILEPIRNIIYRSPLGGPGMMLDFSPLIATVLIQVVCSLLIEIVRKL